jgi:initiation factor 1A
MVKNLTGGSKSKQMGRKFVSAPVDRKIRLIQEEGESYAVVTKLLGNGMFYANDTEGKERICVMRNKFRGKGKRDNTVSLGTWVMIGIRDFDSSDKPKFDLLEVYTDIEKQKLKRSGDPKFLLLKSEYDNVNDSKNKTNPVDDDEVAFGNDDTEKYKELMETVSAVQKTTGGNDANTVMSNQNVVMDDGEYVDVDDI